MLIENQKCILYVPLILTRRPRSSAQFTQFLHQYKDTPVTVARIKGKSSYEIKEYPGYYFAEDELVSQIEVQIRNLIQEVCYAKK